MKDGLQEEYYEDGLIRSQCWYDNGKLHREDGPAVIHYNEDGSMDSQHWHKNGKLHREDQPTSIYYYKDGSIRSQYWRINRKYHREDNPAEIHYYKDGSIRSQYWYKNGKELVKIPQEMLISYMKTNHLTLAELLLSNDELIRTSAQSYKWNNAL